MSLLDYDPQFIPLKNNAKQPAYSYRNRSFDHKFLKQHLARGGNIGLLAQPNFIFIDIDTSHGEDGLGNFEKWCQQHHLDFDRLFSNTLAETTATGGIHLIFRQLPGFAFKQDIGFLPGVDIKASKNNYIVFHPSKIDGHSYHLFDTKQDPMVVPRQLAEALIQTTKATQRKQNRTSVQPSNGLLYHQNINSKYQHLDVFYNIVKGFGPKGVRNNNLFEWARAMRRITTKESTVYFAKIANRHTPSPLGMPEIIRTIDSVFQHEEVRIIDASGEKWVQLESNSGLSDYAVLLTRYQQVKSLWPDDYGDQDKFLANEMLRNSDKRTIWDYREGDKHAS